MRKITALFSATLLGMATLAGCSSEPKAEQAAAPAEAQAQKIVVATEGQYKPFNYVDADGKPVGFDIDVTNALCAELKAECTIITQDWDGIIPGLIAKKYDAIIAGMSITEERKRKVDFSDAYFANSLVFIGKKDATFELSGKKIAAQGSTIASQHAEDNFGDKNEIKTYKTQENAYADLKAGRVDYMFSDKVPAVDWLKSEDGADYALIGEEIDINDEFGVAVRKGDALKGQFDAALAAIKANGEYQKIYDSYFKK